MFRQAIRALIVVLLSPTLGFSRQVTYLSEFPVSAASSVGELGNFNKAWDVVVDGYVYVLQSNETDTFFSIGKYDGAGTKVAYTPISYASLGGSLNSARIGIDRSSGNLLVTDNSKHCFFIYSPNMAYVWNPAIPGWVFQSGSYIGRYPTDNDTAGGAAGDFSFPMGIACNSIGEEPNIDSRVYVVDSGNFRLQALKKSNYADAPMVSSFTFSLVASPPGAVAAKKQSGATYDDVALIDRAPGNGQRVQTFRSENRTGSSVLSGMGSWQIPFLVESNLDARGITYDMAGRLYLACADLSPTGGGITAGRIKDTSAAATNDDVTNLGYPRGLFASGTLLFVADNVQNATGGPTTTAPAGIIKKYSINQVPVGNPQNVATNEDTPLGVTLSATDPDGDSLTYTIVSAPPNGSLSGAGPSYTYTPNANFNGSDSFTFQVTDNYGAGSNVATITITVNPVNDPPVANSQSVTTDEDTPLWIPLTGSDVEGSALNYSPSQPSNGAISPVGQNPIYTPNGNFHGSDSFTFFVNDGALTSNTATVSITVNSVNDAPVAWAGSATTNEDTPKALTLLSSDVDGDALTYSTMTYPANGTLSGTGANRTYTPNPNFFGSNVFSFRTSDGQAFSETQNFTLTINPVNDAPVAVSSSVETNEDTPKAITLTGSDVEGDVLSFSIVSGPANGTLTGAGADRTYTPNLNYNGSDSFTFKVNDGALDSGTTTFTLTILPVNDPPTAATNPSPTDGNPAVNIAAGLSWTSGVDVDGDPITFAVHLSTDQNNLSVYTASGLTSPNYTPTSLIPHGAYFWKIVSYDTFLASATAGPFSFTIANQIPLAISAPSPANLAGANSTGTALTWSFAGDADGDAISFDLYLTTSTNLGQPVFGAITFGDFPELGHDLATLIPHATYYWKVRAKDSFGGVSTGPVWSFWIQNRPPLTPGTPTPTSGAVVVDTQQDVSWAGVSDPDGDAVSYDVFFGTAPENLPLVASGANLAYDPGQLSFNTLYYWQVAARDNFGGVSLGPLWSFQTANNPPTAASGPSPASGANINTLTPTLLWAASTDPEGQAVSYTLFLSTDSNLSVFLSSGFVSPTFLGETALLYNNTYFWRVDVQDSAGAETTGPAWTFRTAGNAPLAPNYSGGQGGLTTTNRSLAIGWSMTDPEGDPLLYDLFVSTANPPLTLAASGLTDPFYTLTDLQYSTTYYWRVLGKDPLNNETLGAVRAFSLTNRAPTEMDMSGSPSGSLSVSETELLLFWQGGEDPDGDAITYELLLTGELTAETNATNWLAPSPSAPRVVYVGQEKSMLLKGLVFGKPYGYQVKSKDAFGGIVAGPWLSFVIAPPIPKPYNFPNPFRPGTEDTTFAFEMPADGSATLDIFTEFHDKVFSIAGENLGKGFNSVTWDGRDERGELIFSGTYIARLTLETAAGRKIHRVYVLAIR